MNRQRLKIAHVPAQFLVDVINGLVPPHNCFPKYVAEELPVGVKLEGVQYSTRDKSYVLLLSHPTFPVIESMSSAPVVKLTYNIEKNDD